MFYDEEGEEVYEDSDYIEYQELLEMVQKKHPEVESLKRIKRSDVVDYHNTIDETIRPFCRIAICEDCPGVVSYFWVAIHFKGEWCFYQSLDW